MAKRSAGRRGRSRKRRPAAADGEPPAASEDGPLATAGGDAGTRPPTRREAIAAKRQALAERRRLRLEEGARARARRAPAPRRPGAGERIAGVLGGTVSPGGRPQAPWHPLPLSELLILVGIVGVVIGLGRGDAGGPLVVAGVVAVLLGTGEVALREHLDGYRSHALILALLPVIVLDTALKLILALFVTPVPVALEIAVLAIDVPLFLLLFKLLRARFKDARRERVSLGRR